MMMTYLFTGMFLVSLLCGILTGNTQAVSTASIEGASSAIDLVISMAGMICLWTGLMEVMHQCGLMEKLALFLRPRLKRLFPDVAQDPKVLGDISANLSANLLGLGNAATPLGIQAAQGLAVHAKNKVATPSLCLFVVCNTASIQLMPTTVASLRAATGSASPLEILPAVWLTSLGAITVGITVCKLLERWEGRAH